MAKSLSAGTLNRQITIEQQSTTQDEFNQPVSSWTPVLTCWANIRVASSKEVFAAAGFVSKLTHVVTIRYTTAATISTAMRVSYLDRTFLIQAVNDPDEAKVMLQLLCLEQDA